MIVTKEDLKGDIADFPIEVVQKMVDYQVEQGNKADPSVFQCGRNNGKYRGGFDWIDTREGGGWWSIVASGRNFDKFFKQYPKGSTNKQAIILKKRERIKLNFNL